MNELSAIYSATASSCVRKKTKEIQIQNVKNVLTNYMNFSLS